MMACAKGFTKDVEYIEHSVQPKSIVCHACSGLHNQILLPEDDHLGGGLEQSAVPSMHLLKLMEGLGLYHRPGSVQGADFRNGNISLGKCSVLPQSQIDGKEIDVGLTRTVSGNEHYA